MSDQIKMAPCPFCEGPPCIIAQNVFTRALVDEDHRCDPEAEEWPDFESHVWCHDYGAQGPEVDSIKLGLCEQLYDLEARDVMRAAVERWNDRGTKARNCYDAGEAEGLNMFPRSAA